MSKHGGPRALRRDSAEPLWAQVLADLRGRMSDGEFNSTFPGELALVEDYQVSRHTIREALRRLRGEGLVSAARGRRPKLVDPDEIEQPVGAIYSLFASVESAGLEQLSLTRALDVRADGVIASRLGLEESTPLVYLERLRMAGDQPLAIDRVWLPADLAAPLLEVDFSHTALYHEYANRCQVHLTGGQEHIRVTVPHAGEQRLLGLKPGSAAFIIERLGCAGRRPVEWRHTVVRGDRFVITADLASRNSYQLALSS